MNKDLEKKITSFLIENFADKISAKIKKSNELKKFKINPFVAITISSGIYGEITSINLAKSLIFPFVLGTSMNTTFGNMTQKMCVEILGATGSSTPGVDIEYDDKISKKRVYAQMKAGPNTINSGDVQPMLKKMEKAYRLLQTNYTKNMPEFSVCILYGESDDLNASYKKITTSGMGAQQNVPIYIGKDFWHRLTGNKKFYSELISIFEKIFEEHDNSLLLEETIVELAQEIDEKFFTKGKFDRSKL